MHYHEGCCHSSNDKSLGSCASPALSDGDLSVNESGRNCSLENYHLDSFHIPKKRQVGNVGHKSPENNALGKQEFLRNWMPSSIMMSPWTPLSRPLRTILVYPSMVPMTRSNLRIDSPRQWKFALSTALF